jgi:plasmid replication DNA-binding protein KfrA
LKRLDEHQIYETAEKFVVENGRTPTWSELRAMLGVGSPTTLNRYYRPWREKKDKELAASRSNEDSIENVPVPSQVIEALNDAWSKSIAEIKLQSNRELDAIRAASQSEKDELLLKIKECEEIIDTLEGEAVAREESCDKATTLLRIEIDAHKKELGEQYAEIAYKAKEIGTLTGRIDELEKQLARESKSAASERLRCEDATDKLADLKAKLALKDDEIAKLKGKTKGGH